MCGRERDCAKAAYVMDQLLATFSRVRPPLLAVIAAVLALTATAGLLTGMQILAGASAMAVGQTSGPDRPARFQAGMISDLYEPHQVLVTLRRGIGSAAAAAYIARRSRIAVVVSKHSSGDPSEALLQLPIGTNVESAVARIDELAKLGHSAISGAIPDYVATASGRFVPNDEGGSKTPGGWQKLQWNFDPRAGVDVPGAWGNLIAAGRPGASGVKIAVIDSGVAFQKWREYRRSPDFAGTKFAAPCNLVNGTIDSQGACTDAHADDQYGHGTFVAAEIAEATNNKIGLTGIAYGATIMPVRVLNDKGLGSETAVAAGIRYAVNQGAQVINLSLTLVGVTANDIPGVISAISYARSKNVTVVGAAGNEYSSGIDWPAADSKVISVGATTYDVCLGTYSNWGANLDLVAPGGSDDKALKQKGCNANKHLPSLDQMDFLNPAKPGRFSLIPMFGTSMSAAEVSAGVAMLIASGAIGANPTPKQILARLEATAKPVGGTVPNKYYGYGLLDIDAATSKRGPTAPKNNKRAATAAASTIAPTTTPSSDVVATTG
jgi:serine protease